MPVFKSEEKLSPEYVPARLVHREGELTFLRTLFSSLRTGAAYHVRAVIVGSVGTGKTSLAKLFGRTLESEGFGERTRVIYTHLNCRINRSLFSVLRRIADHLGVATPRRGYSDQEVLENIMETLRRRDAHLVLCLDEADVLISEEGSDPIYFLTRAGEDIGEGGRISLILVLRDPDYVERLDPQTKSGLGGSTIHLKEYSREQLFDILKYRASEGFFEGAVDDEILDFIAEIGAERGDARYTIDILWRSGKFAEAEGAPRINPEHVRKAVASVYPTIRRENLSYLSRDETFVLLACAKSLTAGRTHVASSEVYDMYRILCEERNIISKGYTTFWENLQQLQDLGFIRITVKSEGMKGRKSLISLPSIPVNLLIEELMKGLKP
ncbi:hypothetical protein HRbin01_00442 [archaeon HR01]|nr:hypothetical protein HRbin01_00442 [archaeon HR01]